MLNIKNGQLNNDQKVQLVNQLETLVTILAEDNGCKFDGWQERLAGLPLISLTCLKTGRSFSIELLTLINNELQDRLGAIRKDL